MKGGGRKEGDSLTMIRYATMLSEEGLVDLHSVATLDIDGWELICRKGFPILLRQCLVNESRTEFFF
jgi:hypothetical protein